MSRQQPPGRQERLAVLIATTKPWKWKPRTVSLTVLKPDVARPTPMGSADNGGRRPKMSAERRLERRQAVQREYRQRQRAKRCHRRPKHVLPERPYPGFPLASHASGQWRCSLNGKHRYFGSFRDRAPNRPLWGSLVDVDPTGEMWRAALAAYQRSHMSPSAG